MVMHDWVIRCRVAMHRSLDIFFRYKDHMRPWIGFEPAGDDDFPWTEALKQYKRELRTKITKLEDKIRNVVDHIDNTTHDDGKNIRLWELFDDMEQCCRQVRRCHVNVQVNMEDFFHPGQHYTRPHDISDDSSVFPQEYHTGTIDLKTLLKQIHYGSDILP
jgi:hypothetical protein